MSLTLQIPDEVEKALNLPPENREKELAMELALTLYARGTLAYGPARRLAGLTKWEFEELLGARQIVRQYTEHDLAADLNAKLR